MFNKVALFHVAECNTVILNTKCVQNTTIGFVDVLFDVEDVFYTHVNGSAVCNIDVLNRDVFPIKFPI